MIKNVTFLGFCETKPGEKLYQDAFDVAKLLGEEGYTIINGGGPGVMKASSEGCKAGGSSTIGVCFNPTDMTNFEGRDKTNPIDKEYMLPNYVERTLKLLELGDAYVIFSGGTGTISEFGMAWGLARLYFGHHKPLILYGKFWEKIIDAFKENMPLRPEELKVFRIVEKPEKVLEALQELSKEENG